MGKREDWRVVEYSLTEEDVEKLWKDYQQTKEREKQSESKQQA